MQTSLAGWHLLWDACLSAAAAGGCRSGRPLQPVRAQMLPALTPAFCAQIFCCAVLLSAVMCSEVIWGMDLKGALSLVGRLHAGFWTLTYDAAGMWNPCL